MKLKNLTVQDDQFVSAEFTTENGDICLEAEVLPFGPMHIEHAIWKETGADAMLHVSQYLASVRDMMEDALPASA